MVHGFRGICSSLKVIAHYISEGLQTHLPRVLKPCQQDFRKTLYHWNSLCMESLTPVFSLLCDLGAGALKITFASLGSAKAELDRDCKGRKSQRTTFSCLFPVVFLSVSCGLPLSFLGLPVLVCVTPTVVVSSCSRNWIQFAVFSLLQKSFIVPLGVTNISWPFLRGCEPQSLFFVFSKF